jgi:hypothetical protein
MKGSALSFGHVAFRTRRRRALAGALGALVLVLSAVPTAGAQDASCRLARLVDAPSDASLSGNIDFFVRQEGGQVTQVRLAGLQPWPNGWPLSDEIRDRVSDQARAQALCLAPVAADGGRGLALGDLQFLDGRGSLAEALARRGWAAVADDAEQVVPALAPRLRAAQAEAQTARLGLWDVLPRLVQYTTPGGRAITADQRLVPALDLLAGWAPSLPLVEVLGVAGVPVFFMDVREGSVLAYYNPYTRVVGVESGLVGADPRTIAMPLAHELVHARDHFTGLISDRLRRRWTTSDEVACFQTEYNAAEMEAQLWQFLFGREGLRPVTHRVELHENIRLEDYLTAPEYLRERIERLYRFGCQAGSGR